MFKLRFHEDQTTGLVAACDKCGSIIEDAATANLLWNHPLDPDIMPGHCFPYVLVCQKCDDREAATKWPMSQDLQIAIGYLCNNVKITNLDEIQEQIQLLSRIQ